MPVLGFLTTAHLPVNPGPDRIKPQSIHPAMLGDASGIINLVDVLFHSFENKSADIIGCQCIYQLPASIPLFRQETIKRRSVAILDSGAF